MLLKLLLGILLVFVSSHIFQLVDKFGYMRYYHTQHPGTCRAIPGVLHGSEDFAVTSKGDVFITTGLVWRLNSGNYHAYAKKKNIQGGIFLFQFSKSDKGVTPITLKHSDSFDPSQFKPHGIDIIEDKTNGEHILFIVNHPPDMIDTVEKFKYLPETKELEHVKTYRDQKFKNLNDIAVTGPESFYTTNMCALVGKIPALVELLSMVKWGSVLFFSDGQVKEVVPGLAQPNGITLSKDGRSLYVSALDILQHYDIQDNGSLALTHELPLNTHLDNIQTHKDGQTLYIGTHPKVHKFAEADDHPEMSVAPSQVIAISLTAEGRFNEKDVKQLLYDHGDLISGSSVAAVVDGKMLVGTVQDKLAFCNINTPAS